MSDLITQISTLMSAYHVDRWQELKILKALSDTSDDGFNEVIEQINLYRLIRVIDNHFPGPKNLTEFLNICSVQRIGALSLLSREKLIDAIQSIRPTLDTQKAVRDVLLNTKKEALSTLKNKIDTGSNHRDLQQLVFKHITDFEIRQSIFSHIKNEAEFVDHQGRKSITDIDDTVYSSLHDGRYPRGAVYPGVLQYHQELMNSKTGQDELIFLTARPQVYKGMLENFTHNSLRKKGITYKTTVLSGSFGALTSKESMAAKKLENFSEFQSLFPEYTFVFTGDSGQGDAILGHELMRQYPSQVEACLIHDVQGVSVNEREEWLKKEVYFFDSYVGAGRILETLGIINEKAVNVIFHEAVTALLSLDIPSKIQRESLKNTLINDFGEAPPSL